MGSNLFNHSIMFLDSLKMHNKNTYAKHVCKWLNLEWKRLVKTKINGTISPFNSKIPSISPKGTIIVCDL